MFWFDTSELPDSVDTEVLTSELRIYKEAVSPIDGYEVESLSKYGPLTVKAVTAQQLCLSLHIGSF